MKETIFLKLLTLPKQPTEELLEMYKNKYEDYKDLQDLESVFLSESGANPLFGRIQSVTLGFVSNGTLRVQILKGSEEAILTDLLNILNNSVSYSVATWNAAFTLPFITTRMAANDLSMSLLPPSLKHLGLRPWNLKQTISVSEYVEGIGWFKSSITEHAYNLSIEHNIIEGEDVYKTFLAGKIQELDDSEADYIKTLVNVYYSFTGEGKIFASDVTIKSLEEDISVERKPVLNRIYLNNIITAEDKKELKELLGKKRITKKGKEILKDMLHKLSINSTMFVGDRPKVIEEKLKVVEELINEL